MTQENFRAIMEETKKYKNVNFTEPLTRLLCSQLLERINKLPNEEVQTVDIETLIKNTVALTRAVAYKKNVEAMHNPLFLRIFQIFEVRHHAAMGFARVTFFCVIRYVSIVID